MAAKPSNTSSAIQTKGVVRSAHSRVAAAIAPTIRTPPMVGVPALPRWLWGPSSRMYCPTCRRFSRSITQGPRKKQMKNAVRLA